MLQEAGSNPKNGTVSKVPILCSRATHPAPKLREDNLEGFSGCIRFRLVLLVPLFSLARVFGRPSSAAREESRKSASGTGESMRR